MQEITITNKRYEELLKAEIRLNTILDIYNTESPWKMEDILLAFKKERNRKCQCSCKQEEQQAEQQAVATNE